MSRRICRAIDLDHEADLAFAELEELKRSFLSSIEALDNPDERDLLYKRYIEFKCWRKVADEIVWPICFRKLDNIKKLCSQGFVLLSLLSCPNCYVPKGIQILMT